ncbi:MAG: ATP phosphoribosyltransferase regulatory subunit [Nocardioidaceae bacterium]
MGAKVLGSLDKLDKATPDAVTAELVERGLSTDTAEGLVTDVTAPDPDQIRKQLDTTERGMLGLAEVDRLLSLTAGLPSDRVVFTPRMVRGLDYYTGPIFEVAATGYPGSIASGGRYDGLVAKLGGPDLPACGGSIGIERILAIQAAGQMAMSGLDVALTVLGAEEDIMRLAAQLRARGLRTGVYLGSSGRLARQLKWANDQHARLVLIYGADEQAAHEITVRDMQSGEQTPVPFADAPDALLARLSGRDMVSDSPAHEAVGERPGLGVLAGTVGGLVAEGVPAGGGPPAVARDRHSAPNGG